MRISDETIGLFQGYRDTPAEWTARWARSYADWLDPANRTGITTDKFGLFIITNAEAIQGRVTGIETADADDRRSAGDVTFDTFEYDTMTVPIEDVTPITILGDGDRPLSAQPHVLYNITSWCLIHEGYTTEGYD